MKWRGVSFLVVASALFAVGDFTGTGWLHLADALLWSVLLISFVLPWFSVAPLEAGYHLVSRRSERGPGPMEGDPIALVFRVRNPHLWPRFGITLTVPLSVNQTPERSLRLFVPYLAPKGTLTVEGAIIPSRRGLYRSQGLVVESEAPFGLFRRRRRLAAEASILVYPAPYPLGGTQVERVNAGPVARPVPIRRGEEVSGSRPYVPGDAARDIHWRNSARAGRFMVKSFTATASETPVLTLGAPPQDEALLDDIVRVAAGVGRLRTQRGGLVRLQTGAAGQELSWEGLLRELALLSASRLPPLSDSLRAIAPGSTVVAVAPLGDRAGLDALLKAAHSMGGLQALLLGPDSDEGHPGAGEMASLERAGAMVHRLATPLTLARREREPVAAGRSAA